MHAFCCAYDTSPWNGSSCSSVGSSTLSFCSSMPPEDTVICAMNGNTYIPLIEYVMWMHHARALGLAEHWDELLRQDERACQ